MPERLTVGLVRGLRGLRGQVRIELLTDRPEDRFVPGAAVYPEGSSRGLTIVEAVRRRRRPGLVAPLPRGPRPRGRRSPARRLPRDRHARRAARARPLAWDELEGLAVRSASGEALGTIVELYRAGEAEVFVVRGPRGEFDVPGVHGIVIDLAPERGEMVVDLEALDLDARPVEADDYVRPRDRRPKNPSRPPPSRGPPPDEPDPS